MTKSTNRELFWVAIFLCCLGILIALMFGSAWWGRGGVKRHVAAVIRRPTSAVRLAIPASAAKGLSNLAPLATVTASSVEESDRLAAEGVADGVPDANQWLSAGETAGAWVKLDWDAPVTISEIELCDRPSLSDNVTSGTLTFDDGNSILVEALPPNGTPWRTVFRPKTVRSVIFRIDSTQGRNAGLAEILVFGTMAR
jgi:hypothetical protein